jgi:hypothetical protein
MRPMDDPSPGERRLSRPPSDRYRPTAIVDDPSPDAGTDGGAAAPARGIAAAVVAAIVVGGLITILGGVLLVTAGLVVVAGAGGWAIALAIRVGAGPTIARSRRRWLAGGLAVAAVIIGQLGLWLFARTEGGVLPPIDYLAQTFGVLVPLQALAAALAAAWTER